jgi:hypothetical protein
MNQRIAVVLLIPVLLCSCSEDSNPGSPPPDVTLIGGIGSQRSYLTTESWFVASTDTPFVVVPDSLLSRITLSDSLRRLGVVGLSRQDESVGLLATLSYNSLHLPLPRLAYKVSTGPDSEYNLYDEVQQLASGRSYRGGTGYNETIWYEDATQVQDASPPNDGAIFPRLPWL